MSNRLQRLNDFYARWGAVVQLITGALLLAVAAFVTFVAISLYSYRSYGDRLVHAQCQRAREFGPPIATFYAREGVLTGRELERYRATIPTHC